MFFADYLVRRLIKTRCLQKAIVNGLEEHHLVVQGEGNATIGHYLNFPDL